MNGVVRGRDSFHRLSTDALEESGFWLRSLASPDYYLSEHTKHGGVVSLTKEEYDRIASEYGLR